MKKYLKEMIPAIILAFVASFMLFIYEPILTYSTNIDDFWFDFKLMLPNILLYSIILFGALYIFYTIIYIIDKICFKKEKIYKALIIISWIIFMCTYIQGNYLIGNLPALDGETIAWGNFVKENIISLCILIVLIILEIIALKKLKYKKTIKINTYIVLAVFVMLLVSFTSILCTPGLFKEKTVVTATYNNIERVSSDKNFFIFLTDAVSSTIFNDVLNESTEYSDMFNDFTYFKNVSGGYPLTKPSIPLILTGKWYKNEEEYTKYYDKAFEESKLFKTLEEKEYTMNLYEQEIYCSEENAKRFDNASINSFKINKVNFYKQLTKYVLFKYLPYPLKEYSQIETVDFEKCKYNTKGISAYSWKNDKVYKKLKNKQTIVDANNKYFKFYHLEGGHSPFNYDENLNRIPEEQGSYETDLKALLKVINEFLNTLKQSGVYDNSVIIVMADHGTGNGIERANPILYIKGINEHHEMITSEKAVSYGDLIDAYEELLEDKKSTDLFSDIGDNRDRIFIRSFFKDEDRMVEYVIKGKAWETDKIEKTGVEYNK